MDGETIEDSTWLTTLRRRHRALLGRVSAEGLFLLIPQSTSLESRAVGVGDVLHHVIRPVDGGRGNHVTLSGRKVVVSSGEVFADAGFPRQVSATVLGTSRITVNRRTGEIVRGQRGGAASPPSAADALSLNCYFISRPLDGGLPGPAAPDELDHGAILAAVAMLRSSPETELVFEHLSASVERVRARCARGRLSEADLDSIQADLHAEWFAAARALAQTSFYSGEPRDALLSAVAQLSQTVESWCMEQLAEPLLARTIEAVGEQCAALRPGIARHVGKTPADFGVKPKIRCNLSASVGCLALVHAAATPLEKLHCLRDTITLTIKCVTRHLEDAGIDLDDVELGSDDILDMLLYIITQANEGTDMADLPGHLEFAYRFHFVPRGDFETSRLGYYYSTFCQALQFFQQPEPVSGHIPAENDSGRVAVADEQRD